MHFQHSRQAIALGSVLVVATAVVAWHIVPEGDAVTVTFVRYERAERGWHAYMEIRNNTSRPIFFHGAGITSTHYVWESPQIDYAWRLQSPMTRLPSKSHA